MLCWSNHEEISHVQGKRNPSKMVCVARGHQRADTLKPYSQEGKGKSLSRVQLFATPWTVAYQDSQSMGFSRQEYWSGLPFPSPGDLPSQSNHTRTTSLSNSMKLSHAHGATQDRWVMVGRSDRMWSTGEGNGKPLQYSCLENPMNSMKRQNDRILKEELPRSVGAQYATGDQWRNNSRKNEAWSQSKNNTQLWM